MFIVFLVLVMIVVLVFVSVQSQQQKVIGYVLYHDDYSAQIAEFFTKYKWATFYKLGRSKYFESAFWPILLERYFEWADKKYVALISYSLVTKQNIVEFPMNNVIDRANGADVITFYKFSADGLMGNSERYHKNFKAVWLELLTKMGYEENVILSDKIPLFPCNCWMAKPEWMKRFLEFAMKAKQIMEHDPNMKSLCYLNSTYKGKMTRNQLKEISGKPYYTFHPFIMERLPCFFFWVNKAKIYDTNIGVPNFYY